VLVVEEGAVDPLDAAGPLDVDVAGAVDHHLGDRLVVKQRLERPEAGDVVDHLLDEASPLLAGDRILLGVDDPVDDALDPRPDLLRGHVEQLVERADDLGLEADTDLANQDLAGRISLVEDRNGRGRLDRRWRGDRRRRGGRSRQVLLRPLHPLHERHNARSPLR
jgi:hypothetical protein